MARLPQALQATPVGRTRLSREELSERQLERLLAAAVEVFAKRGFQDSTVENIVAAAGIGVGSFYAHFDGKEECLDRVCERIASQAEAALATADAEARAEGGGWAERLCAGLHALLAFAAANPLAARVVLLEAQTGGPEAVARHGEMIDRIAAYLRQGRGAGGRDLERPPAFEEATASGLVWLAQERLVRGELDDVDALFAEMAEVALDPYLGAAAARRRIAATLAHLG